MGIMRRAGWLLSACVLVHAAVVYGQTCTTTVGNNFPAQLSSEDGQFGFELENFSSGPRAGMVDVYPLTPVRGQWAVYYEFVLDEPVEVLSIGFGIYGAENMIPGGPKDVTMLQKKKLFNPSNTGPQDRVTSKEVYLDDVPSEVEDCCEKPLYLVARMKYRKDGTVMFASGQTAFILECRGVLAERQLDTKNFEQTIRTTGGLGLGMDENTIMIQRKVKNERMGIAVTVFRKIGEPQTFQRFQTFVDTRTSGARTNFGSFIRVRGDSAIIRMRNRKLGLYRQNPETFRWSLEQILPMSPFAPNTGAAISDDRIVFVSSSSTLAAYGKNEEGVWEKERDLLPIFNGQLRYSLEFDARGDVVACKHRRQKCVILRKRKSGIWFRVQNLNLVNPLEQSARGDLSVMATAGTEGKPLFATLSKVTAEDGSFEFSLDIYGKKEVGGLYQLLQSTPADIGIDGIRPNAFTLTGSKNFLVIGAKNKGIGYVFKRQEDNTFLPHRILASKYDSLDPRNEMGSTAPERGASQVIIYKNRVVTTVLDNFLQPEGIAGHIIPDDPPVVVDPVETEAPLLEE